ncbi:MAG: thiamine diphosphokinase, partial [Oscillospiraceae bacterium]|nr:thiamine diphosphokinase [Oscillospiraceae bacterium]
MKRCIVIGSMPVEFDLNSIITQQDYIICADGGYKHAKMMNLTPAVVIGDMDSIGEHDYTGEVINLPVRKDFTDSEVCVKYILLKDFEEILMLGFTGTRLD